MFSRSASGELLTAGEESVTLTQNYTSCYESISGRGGSSACHLLLLIYLKRAKLSYFIFSFFLLKYRETSEEKSVWLTPERWRYEGWRVEMTVGFRCVASGCVLWKEWIFSIFSLSCDITRYLQSSQCDRLCAPSRTHGDAIKLCAYVCVRDPEGRVEGEWLLVGLGVGCRSVYTDVVWLQKLVVLLSQCHSAGIPSAQQNTSERHRTDMCSLCFTALLMRAKKSL